MQQQENFSDQTSKKTNSKDGESFENEVVRDDDDNEDWDNWGDTQPTFVPLPPEPPQTEANLTIVHDSLDSLVITPHQKNDPGAGPYSKAVESVKEQSELDPKAERGTQLTLDFQKELTDYLHDLADPSVRDQINEALHTRRFKDLEKYYEDRPELVDYTVDNEVSRMRYKVMSASATDANQTITEIEDVKDCLLRHKWSLIVRYANQSIFADLLSALQNRFLRPDINIAIISRDSDFKLDLRTESLEASSEFQISTLSYDMEVRELAVVRGSVKVALQERNLEQTIEMPTMRMIFDDDILATAKVLAENQVLMEGEEGSGQSVRASLLPAMVQAANLDALRGDLLAAGGKSLSIMASAGKVGAEVGEGLMEGMVRSVGTLVGADRQGPSKELRFYRTEEEEQSEAQNVASSGLIGGVSTTLAKGLGWGFETLLVNAVELSGAKPTEEEPLKLYRTEENEKEDEVSSPLEKEEKLSESNSNSLCSRDYKKEPSSLGLQEPESNASNDQSLLSSAVGLVGGSIGFVGGLGKSLLSAGATNANDDQPIKLYRTDAEVTADEQEISGNGNESETTGQEHNNDGNNKQPSSMWGGISSYFS